MKINDLIIGNQYIVDPNKYSIIEGWPRVNRPIPENFDCFPYELLPVIFKIKEITDKKTSDGILVVVNRVGFIDNGLNEDSRTRCENIVDKSSTFTIYEREVQYLIPYNNIILPDE